MDGPFVIVDILIYLVNNNPALIMILIQIASGVAIRYVFYRRPGRQVAVKDKQPVTAYGAHAYIAYNRLRGISDAMYIPVYLAWLGVKNTAQLFRCCF